MALAPTDVASIEETTAIRLVTAHRGGDRDAFDEIVRSHYSSLLATARHRLGNTEDAKDAVQETLLRALLALDRFGDTGDWRLGAWLNTILFHVCADIPARRKPTMPLSDWLIESRPDEAAEETSDYVALAAVRQAIGDLPESQRRAFELRLVDGHSYGEVARALDITEVNARARVRRARAALRHALEDSSAVKGAWAGIPIVLTSPVRTLLRRVFASAGDSARMAGSQALGQGAATTGSSAVSAISGAPVQAGIQLLTQVSATPLGQAVVASATGAPGKGSVVLGIVASLATAGGLSAPAVISGSTPAPTTPQVASVMMPASTSTPPVSAGSASTTWSRSTQTSVTAPISTTSPAPAHQLVPPAWMTLATTAVAYEVTQSNPSSSTAASTSSNTATTGVSGSSTSSGSLPSSSGSPSNSNSSSGVASGTGSASATSTGKTAPATPNPTVPLPIGTCTGVTGFPGVTAPKSVPSLSSSALDALLSTGSLKLATVAGSPAFAGTAVVKPGWGSTTTPVHVKIGTCLADGGSILAVDMTGTTGDQVQLVGALVAQPFIQATGADSYLFRGNVTQIAGKVTPSGNLPWGLPSGFVAEVQVQQKAKTGSLTVLFLRPKNATASTTTASATSVSPTAHTTTTTAVTTSTGTLSAPTTAPSASGGPSKISGGSQASI